MMQATKHLGSQCQFQLVFKTRSSKPNWCFHRFRLYNPTGVTVEARKPDGTVISTQPFRSSPPRWGQFYEHDFLFDLSFNTAKEEIEIYIKCKKQNMFQQVYAVYAHAGSAVRWQDDPLANGMTNAELSYINMAYLKFDYGYSTNATSDIVYIENQANNMVIEGADQFYGYRLDVRNNELTSATVDQLIIGFNNQGRTAGVLDYSGTNNAPTFASRPAYDSLLSKGVQVIGVAPPTS